ncbi:hypothetical protein QVD17_29127 [Tagetes erecta]|uniref:Transposase MuDR plant domain-containing protein n=1 Tax=Tagetes erecta TaxID=13708 RepID=A0AAD8NKY0_TARER|nr:hypothetical protein QVD17_29127 [Tagetes erecta]
MDYINAVSDMIQREDFNTISQIAIVNNDDVLDDEIRDEDNVLGEDGIGDEMNVGDVLGKDVNEDETETETEAYGNAQVPSTYTNLEETNLMIDENWMVPNSESKFDFTRELGKDSFNDKDTFIRAVKLYHIKEHKHFEVVESRPSTWCLRCKLHEQGCKWQLRASKRKRSGSFEITKHVGPHTCLHSKITQDHPNLDASLISQEIQHLIKEQPSISITALRAEVIDKFGYTRQLHLTLDCF